MITSIEALRHKLHAHPEVSLEEIWTTECIYEYLCGFEPARIVKATSGTGLVASWHFSDTGPCIVLRAELDALPIHELGSCEYKSQIPGKAHLCGHDGHMSILCGVAEALYQSEADWQGQIHLLFQPAEENGMGARQIQNDPAFSDIQPDYIFALHNLPGYPLGEVLWKDGPFTAAVIGMEVEFKGIESHAATPEKGVNPAMAISQILQSVKDMEIPDEDSQEFCLITPTHIDLGRDSYGVSAGHGFLRLCLRTWTTEKLQTLQNELHALIDKICEEHSLPYGITWKEHFHATSNDESANQIVLKSAGKLHMPTRCLQAPNRFGEDFGLFTDHFRGCLFCIGAGEQTPPLHNPYYDFPDDLLEPAINLFFKILDELLNQKKT